MRRIRESKAATTVEDFAAGLGERVLHCRELGHVWRPLTVHWDNAAKAYDRRLRCSSCRTVRVQVLTASGGIVSNRYEYADGYLATGVQVGRGNRDVFRAAALVRFLNAHAQDEVA
jgi:hypothetical protein